MKSQQHTSIEPLESRIAPAGLVISGPNGRTATYTDVDGDIVTVTTSKGMFTPTHFHFGPQNALGGQQLEMLDLLDAGQQSQFTGADIAFSAQKSPDGSGGSIGNDSVNLGFLNGSETQPLTSTTYRITGVDLKTFTLPGDIGKIMLGDTVQSTTSHLVYLEGVGFVNVPWYSATVPDSSGGIHVRSIGQFGTTTGAPDLTSTIVASGTLLVDSDVVHASIEYFGRYGAGYVSIGGDLIGGATDNAGRISFHRGNGPGQNMVVEVGGDVVGGAGRGSGTIAGGFFDFGIVQVSDITGAIASISIGGNLTGGSGDDSGQILLANAKLSGRYGGITVNGGVIGGGGDRSGLISSLLDIRDLEIGGDIIGGAGNGSGGIHAGQERLVAGNTQAVQIADEDAMVKGKITTAIIHGSIIGGSNVSTTQRLDRSGFIEAAEIGTLTIEGSVVAGTDAGGGLSSSGSIRADKTITKLWVKGETRYSGQAQGALGGLIGNATNNVVISAGNKLTTLWVGVEHTNTAKTILNYANVSYTSVLAGYQHDTSTIDLGDAANADADIGTVRITGNFTASNIIAGVQTGTDLLFGTGDDASIVGGVDVRANKSTIANIVIRGAVVGTAATGDHFGVVAEKITRVEIGGVVQTLTIALNSINILDLTIKEVV